MSGILKKSCALTVLSLGGIGGGMLWADAPSLPSGLGGGPALPPGLGGDETIFEKETERELDLGISGFVEARYGRRLERSFAYPMSTLSELRTRLDWEGDFDRILVNTSVDLLYDEEEDGRRLDLESARSWLDLRELNLEFTVAEEVDVKLGRQVATWGVGDLVFINDLFPKDWNAFFLGRDVEYMKAPQDSLRISWYSKWANLDFVYSPEFESDRMVDGRRLVYFDESSGGVVQERRSIAVEDVGDAFDEDEMHIRVSRLLGRFEYAVYLYSGYWKSPAGMDLETGLALFPCLTSYGMSARGPWAKGVLSFEAGYYDSQDFGANEMRRVRGSESRLLLGYEHELAKELTGSLQYYVERSREKEDFEKDRELLTLRLRKQLLQQRLILSAFGFYSPSDYDAYWRLGLTWKVNDEWRYDLGVNIFQGMESSFFGQFGGNDNTYLSVRRIF